jgi:hypothetical protein
MSDHPTSPAATGDRGGSFEQLADRMAAALEAGGYLMKNARAIRETILFLREGRFSNGRPDYVSPAKP